MIMAFQSGVIYDCGIPNWSDLYMIVAFPRGGMDDCGIPKQGDL